MKTLKSLTAALLIILSANAFAIADETKNNKLQMDYAINTYVEAMSNGKIKELPSVLDPDVKFTTSKGNEIKHYSKTEMLESLKSYENIVQNCQTDYKLIESGAAQAIVKVTMKYETFSKVHLLTLNNTAKGWKIVSVSSSFN